MKYTSNNIFSDFEFHDAYFQLISIQGNAFTISVQFLNIHKNTVQNPHNTDMEITLAQITFGNFQVMSFEPGRTWKRDKNGKLYTDEPQVIFEGEAAKEKTTNELHHGITIFAFGTLENGNCYFDGAGEEPWFTVQFLFDSVTIEWDSYRKPAWYHERMRHN